VQLNHKRAPVVGDIDYSNQKAIAISTAQDRVFHLPKASTEQCFISWFLLRTLCSCMGRPRRQMKIPSNQQMGGKFTFSKKSNGEKNSDAKQLLEF
jgi:hypothetical protein